MQSIWGIGLRGQPILRLTLNSCQGLRAYLLDPGKRLGLFAPKQKQYILAYLPNIPDINYSLVRREEGCGTCRSRTCSTNQVGRLYNFSICPHSKSFFIKSLLLDLVLEPPNSIYKKALGALDYEEREQQHLSEKMTFDTIQNMSIDKQGIYTPSVSL